MISVSFWACKAIIEEDITNSKIIVNAPKSDSLASYNQLFWWEKVDGALTYQLQIASPNFDSLQTLALDSTVTTNKVNFTLAAGRYQWRVRALNGSYQTQYFGSTFTILPADLNTQTVTLNTPATNSYVNTKGILFQAVTWSKLPINGLTYEVQADNANTFTGTLILDSKTQSSTANIPIAGEGAYYWRVRAFKGTDTSYWSLNSYSFTYDTTAPAKVVLTAPTNSAINQTVAGTLTWQSLGTAGSIKYNVYITYGSAAEVLYTTTNTSYPYSGTTGETVKWRVLAVDLAGNKGATSDTWQFKIQ
ncbi:MAG TPA: hypothetical protein VK750_06585 [Cytophagaceae bacterium]|nr:hypothetical protein [Cytophagaceae bacterium]